VARASTATKLPLYRWAQLAGLNPLHFCGVDLPTQQIACEAIWQQHAWQLSDRISREEVAQAIARAEADIERQLGYRLLPSWEVDEWQPTQRPAKPELIHLGQGDIRGFGQVVKADWGWMISGGTQAKDLVEAGASIVYTDSDSDGYFETATVTVNVLFSSACELRVYCPGHNGDAGYEIRPVTVSIAGGVATVTFRREQAVDPILQETVLPLSEDSQWRGVNGSNDLNFLEDVDVYRVYNDPQLQVQLLWAPYAVSCANCEGGGCPTCAYTTQTGCLIPVGYPRQGVVTYRPADWNADTSEFDAREYVVGRQPDLVRLHYYAGHRMKAVDCPTIEMEGDFERWVTYLSIAYLDRPICGCNNVANFVDYWQQEMAQTGTEKGIQISERDRDCPFGTTRGAIYVWRRLMSRGITKVEGVFTS
jgi:hypothetical protein